MVDLNNLKQKNKYLILDKLLLVRRNIWLLLVLILLFVVLSCKKEDTKNLDNGTSKTENTVTSEALPFPPEGIRLQSVMTEETLVYDVESKWLASSDIVLDEKTFKLNQEIEFEYQLKSETKKVENDKFIMNLSVDGLQVNGGEDEQIIVKALLSDIMNGEPTYYNSKGQTIDKDGKIIRSPKKDGILDVTHVFADAEPRIFKKGLSGQYPQEDNSDQVVKYTVHSLESVNGYPCIKVSLRFLPEDEKKYDIVLWISTNAVRLVRAESTYFSSADGVDNEYSVTMQLNLQKSQLSDLWHSK